MIATAPHDYHRRLEVAQAAAAAASEVLRLVRTRRRLEIRRKGHFDFVTEADIASHLAIKNIIVSEFPDDIVVSEEDIEISSHELDDYWLIDPLDGTVNFIHGHDHVAVSIAYIRNGKSVVGVVSAPFRSELYWAIAGCGGFCNGERLAIGHPVDASQVLIGIGFPHERKDLEGIVARLHPLLTKYGDIRRLAAPALDICWVVNGRLDAFLDRIRPWDIAAAGLIASEAGAQVSLIEKLAGSLSIDDGEDYLVAHPVLSKDIAEYIGLVVI